MAEKLYLKNAEGHVTVMLPRNWLQITPYRTQVTKKAESKPLDLSEPQRCYHIIKTILEGEIALVSRCENNAVQDGKHGWLCAGHTEEVHGSLAQLRFEAERQIIADILLMERTAIKNGKREVVSLSPTQSITYLVR